MADRTLNEEISDPQWSRHACRDGYVRTAPVEEYRANGHGLHDMLGNAREWTCSEYDANYRGAESECASGSAGRRVIRGGSLLSGPGGVRSAYRFRRGPGDRTDDLGFRLAQD